MIDLGSPRQITGIGFRTREMTDGTMLLRKLVGSSQSRIAKMEVGDPSVSIDLLMKTLLTMGASRTELARVISRRKSKARAA